MSDDLIKRVCQSWIDAGMGDDNFWEGWPGCPTDDTLSAKEVLNRIEQLERENYQLIASLEMCNFAWDQALQQRDEAEAKLAKAVEALREIAGSVPYADNPWHIALAALAELEGKE